MITTIYVSTSLLTGFLIVLGIISLVIKIKAKKLFPQLLFDLGQKSRDEIVEMISSELKKKKKDQVRILALQKVIEHRFSEPKATFVNSVKEFFGIILDLIALPLFILFFGIKIVLFALIPTAIIGGIIFLLSLVITIVKFNWVFIGIIFAISFLIFSIREIIMHYEK